MQIKDSYRYRALKARGGIKGRLLAYWDAAQGWIAAAMIGVFTASVAFLVDVAEITVADYKGGYCKTNVFRNREMCCVRVQATVRLLEDIGEDCPQWHDWSHDYGASFAIYVAFAVLFGVVAGSVTMTTKANLPAVSSPDEVRDDAKAGEPVGKVMYMAAGSGIPEIKTILSGFVIPHFLDFKVLVVKAVGSTFAVATGMWNMTTIAFLDC